MEMELLMPVKSMLVPSLLKMNTELNIVMVSQLSPVVAHSFQNLVMNSGNVIKSPLLLCNY